MVLPHPKDLETLQLFFPEPFNLLPPPRRKVRIEYHTLSWFKPYPACLLLPQFKRPLLTSHDLWFMSHFETVLRHH